MKLNNQVNLNRFVRAAAILNLIFLAIMLPSMKAWADVDALDPLPQPVREWKKEGQFLTIQIVSGKPAKIYVFGREEAKLNLADLKLTVRRLNPYPGKTLSVDRAGNYFSLPYETDLEKIKKLEVKATVENKMEVFQFNFGEKP